MILIRVKCRGTSPLLMNRMSEDTLEGLRTKAKKPKNKDVGKTSTRREDAEPKVYLSKAGAPVIPGENLMSCLIAGGVFIRLDAKRQVSTGKATLLPGLLTLLDTQLQVVDPDTGKPATWDPDTRKGTNPNGNEAVCIVRPRFDRWAFVAKIEIDDSEIGENAIRNLWDLAGRRIGLGDFRPSRKGIFGQFVVECWDRIEKSDKAAE
jgi:hypothetical protein